jgi:hypothetical protein
MRTASLALSHPSPVAPDPGAATSRPAESIEALLAGVADRLRPACRPMPPAALDALVESVVLDAVRFALRWAHA